MIREAVFDDLLEILRMGRLFCAAIGEECDRDSIARTVEDLIEHGILLIGDGCMVGAVVFPYFMSRERVVAAELFWWVDEDKRNSGLGTKLLDALELAARERGAERLSMMAMESLNPEGVGRLYEKRGYRRYERTYVKEL